MTNRQSLFDMLETYTAEDFSCLIARKITTDEEFAEMIAEKIANKIGKTKPRKKAQTNMYYKTDNLAKMFNVTTQRIGTFASMGSRIFPEYVKIYSNGKGAQNGYYFEKAGIDRLYRENPHFFDREKLSKLPSEEEARQ